ncbi:type VII toxin-antitoxin system MntA family adenylyltransferase antitoxin [Priestia koreensis]|uniref:type VII toxin-antitoxin system MntA family adenylyltransferase antitoxin n=1 Tax=Priestia koreensis TaxID=284581 RepID=UPI003CFC8E13
MLDKDVKKIIVDFLIRELSPSIVYLFGSQATGHVHKESDYDIAYVSEKTLSHYERFMIAQQLASILNKDVDLINLDQASTVFQVQIISNGEVLYCTDEHKKSLFEMITLKKYAILNEDRKEILDGVSERGQIYEE